MRISLGYILIGAFICAALAAIVGGIPLVGTPAEHRLAALDLKRVGDLNRIGGEVRNYWHRTERLPSSLADMSKEWVVELADPVTGQPYTYKVTGERSFHLCAVFARKDGEPRRNVTYYRFKTHEKGFHCFDQTVVRKAPESGRGHHR